MFRTTWRLSRRAPLAILIGALTLSAAAAGSVHRFAITTGSGSGGAQAFLQSTGTGGALQGQVLGNYTALPYPFGVFGFDDNSSTFGLGVVGITANGYGGAFESMGGSPSLYAYATGTGDGLDVNITQSTSTADGIYINDQSTTAGADDFYATGPGSTGVSILSKQTGEAADLRGYSGNATHPALNVSGTNTSTDLAHFVNQASGNPSVLVQGTSANHSGAVLFSNTTNVANDVQLSGDLYIYGRIFQDCTTFPVVHSDGGGCYEVPDPSATRVPDTVSRTSGGTNVQMYGSRQTLPTVEDFGEGQLVGGRGYVRIDPAFAATMSHASPYLVFITPSGDSHGVFVTNRSPAGFEVRENGGGRSTMAFDYRIVGSPLGERAARLAVVPEAMPKTFRAPVNPNRSDPKADLLKHEQQQHIHPLLDPAAFRTR